MTLFCCRHILLDFSLQFSHLCLPPSLWATSSPTGAPGIWFVDFLPDFGFFPFFWSFSHQMVSLQTNLLYQSCPLLFLFYTDFRAIEKAFSYIFLNLSINSLVNYILLVLQGSYFVLQVYFCLSLFYVFPTLNRRASKYVTNRPLAMPFVFCHVLACEPKAEWSRGHSLSNGQFTDCMNAQTAKAPAPSALQHTKKIINFISLLTAGDIIYLIQRGL